MTLDTPTPPTAVQRLHGLIDQMRMLASAVDRLEADLKDRSAELRHMRENLIPEAMAELGLDDLTTSDGTRVWVADEVRASLPKDPAKRAAAYAYLEASGNDGLIKQEFAIRYGRDQTEWAQAFAAQLEQLGVAEHATIEQTRSIHHQTLLAFLRAQLREGAPVPLEAFGAFVQRIAKTK